VNSTVSSSSSSARTPDTTGRRTEFCARIRDERQRRDRSLGAIAATTKLQASLLEAFERGDVSRWPKGIYRKSFFRDYVTAIGLPADPHLAEFMELFPDAEAPTSVTVSQPVMLAPASAAKAHEIAVPPVPDVVTAAFRITLAEEASAWAMRAPSSAQFRLRVMLRQAGGAIVDVAVVGVIAYLLSRWTGDFWFTLAIFACTYYALGTALLGRPLASTLLIRPALIAEAVSTTVSLGQRIRARLQATRERAPELLALVERAARQRPRVPGALSRLVSRLPALSSFQIDSERERELEDLRRRRVESASDQPAEEASS
jgi:hypothetical protein